MFKYVIAVAFVSSVALSVNALGEWDEDAQAYCVQTCESYCENCTEPERCGEGEKKCGEQPIDPNMSQCSTDDICVPDNCECKYFPHKNMNHSKGNNISMIFFYVRRLYFLLNTIFKVIIW